MDPNTTRAIRYRKTPNDAIYTPPELVTHHLGYIKEHVNPNDVIYDPFYGDGRYYNSFKNHFTENTYEYTEIEMGLDFFDFNKSVDVIVSNPPYSILDKVFEKCIELKPHTISFLIGHINLTPKRMEMMNNAGYYLCKSYITQVHKWFGRSIIVVFTNKQKTNCIDFDRNTYGYYKKAKP
jgi:DNA modification methylase